MNCREPHEILDAPEIQKLKAELQEDFVKLEDREAAELQKATLKERRQFLDRLPRSDPRARTHQRVQKRLRRSQGR